MDNWGKRKNGQAYKKKPKTSSGQTNELSNYIKNRKEKQLKNKGIHVKKISVTNFENLKEGIDFKITKYGKINYIKGFGNVLEKIGGKKLTDNQIKELSLSMNNKKLKNKNDINNFINSKQNNNTVNYGSLYKPGIDFGSIDYKNKSYIAYSTNGEFVKLKDYNIFDITDINTKNKSKHSDDIYTILNPEISMNISIDNINYDIFLNSLINEKHEVGNGGYWSKNGKSFDETNLDIKHGLPEQIIDNALIQYSKMH